MKTSAINAFAINFLFCLVVLTNGCASEESGSSVTNKMPSDVPKDNTQIDLNKFALGIKFAGARVDIDFNAPNVEWRGAEPPSLDTLRSNSEVVVVAEVVSAPLVVASAITEFMFEARIIEVLAGPAPSEQQILVMLWMPRNDSNGEPAFLKAGSRSLLFLKRIGKANSGNPIWSTPYRNFGAEAYSEAKAKLCRQRVQNSQSSAASNPPLAPAPSTPVPATAPTSPAVTTKRPHVEGAFGLKFGATFDPSTATPTEPDTYKFTPSQPSPFFQDYYVTITPKTKKVYLIKAAGKDTPHIFAECRRALEGKYGKPSSWRNDPPQSSVGYWDTPAFLDLNQRSGTLEITCRQMDLWSLADTEREELKREKADKTRL